MDAIKNFIAVTDKIGTAGQPKKDQFDLVKAAEYQHVINLAMPDHPDSISNEAEIVTSLGMSYFHIPVPYDCPLPIHVSLFCRLMQILNQEKVFVHCIMNYRVSAFLFHYFSKVLELDEKASMSPMFKYWKPEPVWAQLLEWSAEEIGLVNTR